jgi:hypothetical protein
MVYDLFNVYGIGRKTDGSDVFLGEFRAYTINTSHSKFSENHLLNDTSAKIKVTPMYRYIVFTICSRALFQPELQVMFLSG